MRDGGILHPAESLPLLGCFTLIVLTSVIPIRAPWGVWWSSIYSRSRRLNTGWGLCEHRKGTWTVSFTVGSPLGPVWERPGVLSSVQSPSACNLLPGKAEPSLQCSWEQSGSQTQHPGSKLPPGPLLSLGRRPLCGVRGETRPTQPRKAKINP